MTAKIIFIFFFLCSCLSKINGQRSKGFPHINLKNKFLKIGIYLPDTAHGYYRAARFDWAGVISSLQYKNHEYFGEWFNKHDPFVHDAITGPVEEFSAVGYEEVKAGGTFMKIGVGLLEKPDESQYRFSTKYKIIDHGIWKIEHNKSSVAFTHYLQSSGGYGYVYRKVLAIKSGSAEMILTHSIKNTGDKTISATVYDHNMFTIDNTTSGKNFTVTFPFRPELKSQNNDSDSLLVLVGNSIHFKRDFLKGEKAKIDLAGFGNSPDDYSITIENVATGAGVTITGSRPIYQLAYWCIPTVLSPEPFIRFNIAPNERLPGIFIIYFIRNKHEEKVCSKMVVAFESAGDMWLSFIRSGKC